MAEKQDELDLIFQEQREVDSSLRYDHNIIRRFLNTNGEFIQRAFGSAEGDDATGENHATCTAFCLYYLTRADLIVPHEVSSQFVVLTEEEARKIVHSLGEAIAKGHAAEPDEDGAARPGRELLARTDTSTLPNQYNSSIQVVGYLRAARALKVVSPAGVGAACESVVNFLVNLVLSNRGFVPRIEALRLPSPYLTFWAGAVLEEWLASEDGVGSGHGDSRNDIQRALNQIGKWSELSLAESLAFHHAGLTSKFDIIELAYSALAAVQFSRTLEARQMARYGISILFTNYFDDGCFNPSAPVLADQQNYSLLVPTAESLALLLTADLEVFLGLWRELFMTYLWLRRHRVEGEGWYSEHDVRYGKPTAFMTASSLVFLSGLSRLLDEVLCQGASEALRVPPYSPDPSLAKIRYPAKLGTILEISIIKPITERQYSDLASYSMILYGPPGTSKTTIARKLAQDLKWPLLVLNQSDFLKKGLDNIDAEADRIFRLAYYLKDVVILFDEVEELVEDRQSPDKLSRLLTTSMLPRIHTLRDRQRVVFIFATNHLEAIDKAASRRGRFDIIQCVMPPTEDERKQMLDGILKKFFQDDSARSQYDKVRTTLESEKVVSRTGNFGYKDIEALVRRILTAVRIEDKELDSALIGAAISDSDKNIDRQEIERFEQSRTRLERA
jgi:hypothetical protein